MSLFVCLLTDIVTFIQMVILCDMFFSFQKREEKHNIKRWAIASLSMSIVSVLIFICKKDVMETIIYIMLITLLLYMLYSEKITNIALVSTWLIFALSMLYTMTEILINISMDLLNITGEDIVGIVTAITSLILVYLIARVYKKNSTIGIKSIGVVNLFWFTLLMVADTLVVTVIAVMNAELNLDKYRNIYLFSVVLVIIGIFIQLAAVIFLFMQRNVYKEKKQLTEKYLNEQKNYYEYLENREKETKKFRHDLRSHMELILPLVRNHEYEKIESYLEQMQIKVDSLGNNVTVQNGTVDAIINQYYAKAKQQGITMEVQGRFPEECLIDIYDICTIFSNVLSNALEAAAQTSEKYISVECRYTDRNIIIVVKNSFNSDQPGGNVQLKTRKGNVDYHGFGLENMKDSINKYNGVFDIETKDNLFILTILFNNIGK